MKRVLIALGIILAVLVIAVLAIPFVITGDFVASRAADAVEERTGRQLTFGGPVELSLFPDIELSAENVSLSNADWAEAEDMVRFERLELGAGLFDLIGGTLDLRRLVLIRPQVVLEVAEDGRASWRFPPGEPAEAAEAQEPAEEEPGEPMDIRLGDVRIENAELRYVDRASGRTVVMQDGQLAVALAEGGPLTVDGSAEVNGRPVTLAVEASSPQAMAAGDAGSLAGSLDAELMSLTFDIDADPEAASASGPVRFAIPSVGDLAAWLEMPTPDPLPISTVEFDGIVSVAPDSARLSDISLRLDDMTAQGSAGVDMAGAVPRLEARLQLSAIDVDRLMAAMKIGGAPTGLAPPPPEPGAAEDADTAEPAPQALDWSALRRAELDLDVSVEGMTVQGREIGATRLTVLLEDGELAADLAETAMLGGSVAAELAADADAAAFEASVRASGIEAGPFLVAFGPFSSADLPLSAELALAGSGETRAALVDSLTGTLSATVADGRFALPDPEMQAANIAVSLDMPDLEGPVAGEGSLTLNGEPLSWSLHMAAPRAFLAGEGSATALSVDSAPVAAAFDGRASAAPVAAGALQLSIPSVPALLGWLPGGPAGAEIPLESVELTTALEMTATRVALAELVGSVDGTSATGELAADVGGAIPALYARLQLGRLDLDRYVGPAGGGAQTGGAGDGNGGAGDGWSTEPIDVGALRSANIDAVVAVDAIVARGTEVGATEISLLLADGVLDLTVPGAPVYGGTIAVDLGLDASTGVPALALGASAQGVQARPVLERFAGTDRLSGTAALTLDVTASGASQSAMVDSLGGTADVLFTDGALSGINIAAILRNPIAYLRGGPPDEAQSTDFAEFGGSFVIADGIARTDDLRMLAPLFRVEGGGTVALPPQTLDLRLLPTLVPTLEGQGGEFEQAGLQVPILIQGSFSDPQIRPDFSNLALEVIDDPARAAEAIEQLRQGASPQDIFGGLIGGGAGDTGDAGREGEPSPEDALRQLGEGLLGGGGQQQQEGEAAEGAEQPQERRQSPDDAVGDAIRGLFSR